MKTDTYISSLNNEDQRDIFNNLLLSGEFRIIPLVHPDDCLDNMPEYITNAQVLTLLNSHGISLSCFADQFGAELVYSTDRVMTWLGY